MSEHAYHFKDVTLLITHYNRSGSLGRLLNTFKDINCSFGDVVISDNASETEHLEYIANLSQTHNFRLITSPVNKGLGNNINKGQDAVKTKYTVYIQDDFIPLPSFPDHFKDALDILEEDKSWDLVSFYSYVPYPYLKPYKNGFSEKIFKAMPWYTNHLKFYVYGDHPHLRRSDFFSKFGRYKEGVNLDETERDMCLAFIKNKGKALFYDDHYGLLDQQNSESEPSTATYRKEWRQRKTPFVLFMKWFYLKYKFLKINFQLLIK